MDFGPFSGTKDGRDPAQNINPSNIIHPFRPTPLKRGPGHLPLLGEGTHYYILFLELSRIFLKTTISFAPSFGKPVPRFPREDKVAFGPFLGTKDGRDPRQNINPSNIIHPFRPTPLKRGP